MTSNIQHFFANTLWHGATIEWFNADWSPRDYARVTRNDGMPAILLKSPPDNSPDAMIGHEIGKWASINAHFKSLGLNVPDIYMQDLDAGLILMQDFGNDTIADKGIEAYLKATDILIQMRDHPYALNNDLLIKYEDTHVYKALRFFPLYILSTPTDADNDSLVKGWFAAWEQVQSSLPPCPRALTHIDFHPANLMWIDDKIGIIDFQAACNGPFVYDIVNLLEDIRRDVPEDIKTACQNHYCQGLSKDEKVAFDPWYPVITAQFYARILGQIQYLAQEKNRTDLMQYYVPLLKRWEKLLHLPNLRPILQVIKGSE